VEQRKPWNGQWTHESLGEFDPERWLITDDDGIVQFDSRAGPMHASGAGTRGCFGDSVPLDAIAIQADQFCREEPGVFDAAADLHDDCLGFRALAGVRESWEVQGKRQVDTSA
jgi:hypothetical protein